MGIQHILSSLDLPGIDRLANSLISKMIRDGVCFGSIRPGKEGVSRMSMNRPEVEPFHLPRGLHVSLVNRFKEMAGLHSDSLDAQCGYIEPFVCEGKSYSVEITTELVVWDGGPEYQKLSITVHPL